MQCVPVYWAVFALSNDFGLTGFFCPQFRCFFSSEEDEWLFDDRVASVALVTNGSALGLHHDTTVSKN